MVSWSSLGQNHLRAAQLVLDECPRSSASRAYYAAHVVLAEALIAAGRKNFGVGRQTPAHNAQASLIGEHLSSMGKQRVKELKALMTRLYTRRIEADYKRGVTLDRSLALESIRNASSVFVLLGIK